MDEGSSIGNGEDTVLATGADLNDLVGPHGDEGGVGRADVTTDIARAVSEVSVDGADYAAVGACHKAKAIPSAVREPNSR